MTHAATTARPAAPARATRFRIHGIDVRIETDDSEAGAAVAATYAAFAIPPDEGAAHGQIVRHRIIPGVSPVLTLLDQVVDVVLTGLAAQGILVIHAGVVTIDGRAVLLSGRSGAGKSTLTLALVRAGAGWLTDELALIGPDDVTVLPYPRAIHVSPQTVALLPELGFLAPRPRQALGGDSEWSVTGDDVMRAFGGQLAPATQLAGIILLDGQPDARRAPHLRAVPAALATMELLRETPAAAHDFQGTMARLGTITQRVPCFRLDVGELAATEAVVRAWAGALP